MSEKIIYPMRINKYLALKNIASRREADDLIRRKKVKINDRLAVLGDKVSEKDKVVVAENSEKDLVYLAFNKPKKIITHSPQGNELGIKDIVSLPKGVFPVGRLDKDSWGLLILTNDGRVTGKLLTPAHNHEKEYSVMVDRPLSENFEKKMGSGVKLDDGYVTKKCAVKKTGGRNFSIILTEGKKRQIRRMCQMLGYEVLDLKRVRILDISLGKLPAGQFRKIQGIELKNFLKALHLGE